MSLENTIQELRSRGHRLTPQRLAILQAVLESDQHPTAEDIYQQVLTDYPMISLATVYKTLHVLESLNKIIELNVGGSSHYDGQTTPHPHLICINCKRIIDLPPELMVKLPQNAIKERGFHVLWYSLEVHGLCAGCKSDSV